MAIKKINREKISQETINRKQVVKKNEVNCCVCCGLGVFLCD